MSNGPAPPVRGVTRGFWVGAIATAIPLIAMPFVVDWRIPRDVELRDLQVSVESLSVLVVLVPVALLTGLVARRFSRQVGAGVFAGLVVGVVGAALSWFGVMSRAP